jgi:DNA-binding PadR family transcriptional regulator
MARQAAGVERATRTLTTTEAAVLALLAIEGERSGYDLLKLVSKAIGYVWTPARSQLYSVLPRLVRAGLAESRKVVQAQRPDKQLYRVTDAGREALREWHETVTPGAEEAFLLRLFVGGLTTPAVLIGHVEQFRADTRAYLDELRAIEPTNTRSGHDFFHYFLLRGGVERAEQQLAWADWVLAELRERAE